MLCAAFVQTGGKSVATRQPAYACDSLNSMTDLGEKKKENNKGKPTF